MKLCHANSVVTEMKFKGPVTRSHLRIKDDLPIILGFTSVISIDPKVIDNP